MLSLRCGREELLGCRLCQLDKNMRDLGVQNESCRTFCKDKPWLDVS